jgi:hypothetical protein
MKSDIYLVNLTKDLSKLTEVSTCYHEDLPKMYLNHICEMHLKQMYVNILSDFTQLETHFP